MPFNCGTSTSNNPTLAETSQTKPSLVTHTTTRTDLSLFYRVLRSVIRPLKPRLISFPEAVAGGSLPLDTRPKSCYGISIVQRKIAVPKLTECPIPVELGEHGMRLDDLYLYDFTASPADSPNTTIYYFSGGGFQSFPSGEHCKLCARMAKDLADQRIKVVLVSYPLAPNTPAMNSLPLLRRWLRITALSPTVPGKVILMGDSSGGNVVLSLAFWHADLLHAARAAHANAPPDSNAETLSDVTNLERLVAVVSISPPTDLRNTNPEIKKVAPLDPVLTQTITESAAEKWSTGMPRDHPALSPLLADLTKLRRSGMRVHGVVGTHDCLAPDAMDFKRLCEKEGVPGKWLVWEDQMHCFPLTACYGLREGKEGLKWIEDVIREDLE